MAGGPIKFQIDAGLATELVVDATPEFDIDGDVETTDHPVEEGFDSTDHAREKPITISATCVVSNTPVDKTDREIRDATNSDWTKAFATGSYSQQFYDNLVKMKADRQLHTITCRRGTFPQMLLTKLSTPERAEYGDGLMFKVNFKQIRIVTSATAQFVAIKQPATRHPTDKENQAKKQGTPTSPDADNSWALDFKNAAVDFITK